MSFGVVIAAGGIGRRMQLDIPKQFIKICGRPIICHTLDRFVAAGVEKLVISCHRNWLRELEVLLVNYPPSWGIVEGGARRQDSVLNGIKVLDGVENILVHDAVRPFVRPALIKRCAAVLDEEKAMLVALPARDTLKEVCGNRVVRTIGRGRVWLAQTPQGGARQLLMDAMAKVSDVTDEAMAFEQIGIVPFLVEGEPWNIKVTTAQDLVIAEAIARRLEDDADWHRL